MHTAAQIRAQLRTTVRALAEVRERIRAAETAFFRAARELGGEGLVTHEEKVEPDRRKGEAPARKGRREGGGEGGERGEECHEDGACGGELVPAEEGAGGGSGAEAGVVEEGRDGEEQGSGRVEEGSDPRRGRAGNSPPPLTPPLPPDTVHRIVRRAFRYVGRVIHPDRCSDARHSQRFPEICAARDVPELHPIVLVAEDCRIRMCLGTTHLRLLRVELSKLLHEIRQEKSRAVYRFATARTEGERQRFVRIYVGTLRRTAGGGGG